MRPASYNDLEVRRQRALDEAAAWQVRLQDHTPTLTERESFTDWLRESPLHVAAMLKVSHTEQSLASFAWDDMSREAGPFNDTVLAWPLPFERKRPETKTKGAGSARVMTVCLGALAAAVAVVTLWWEGLIGGAVYRTGTGERQDVALQDGSTLRLGPQTRVRVQLSEDKRYLVLERGEAVFKVAKDPKRPFLVVAERTRVRAVGTEFGVEKRDGSVFVTVAEGRVAVIEDRTLPLSFLRTEATDALPVALAAGEQIAVPAKGTTRAVRKVNTANSLAWANGRLVFENEPLNVVVERFNQYNRIQLVVADPQIGNRRISGSFDATDLDSFLTFLRSAVPATIERKDNTEVAITATHAQLHTAR